MASTSSRPPAPAPPPSTPANPTTRLQAQAQSSNTSSPQDANATPSTDTRMNPPSVPRSLMTPSRDMRESSVVSSGGSARKPRQNVDERDHRLMVKLCIENREDYKEGAKGKFWGQVNQGFQTQTGKVLAQLSATVGRLVEARRRQIVDWEQGVIPEKPGGELNALLDQWIEFLRTEDGDGEAERMAQVEAKRKLEEARKEARRQAFAAEQLAHNANPQARALQGPAASSAPQQAQSHSPPPRDHPPQQALAHIQPNGDLPELRPLKRRRPTETHIQPEAPLHRPWGIHSQPPPPLQAPAHTSSDVRRVIVEGALTKDDWREIMGNDARLRALETKVDKIELIVAQNNKLLLQLLALGHNGTEARHEEERVPVHLDAEFERDYLSGRYAKTPLPIP